MIFFFFKFGEDPFHLEWDMIHLFYIADFYFSSSKLLKEYYMEWFFLCSMKEVVQVGGGVPDEASKKSGIQSHQFSSVQLLSRFRLFATLWTVAYQAPPSMGFSRQEYWSGLPFPSPGDLPDPGIEPRDWSFNFTWNRRGWGWGEVLAEWRNSEVLSTGHWVAEAASLPPAIIPCLQGGSGRSGGCWGSSLHHLPARQEVPGSMSLFNATQDHGCPNRGAAWE